MVGVSESAAITANDLRDSGWKSDWSVDEQKEGNSTATEADILALFSQNSRRDQFMLKHDLDFDDLTPELQDLLYPEYVKSE
ncbi:hypothetical protein [Ruegeria sp. HKCCD7255]|uniref:hypothetical protein n=1 Tax=Ruegeria sp. HKCCD7255 TaxID=2683004 RepID=UPI00148989CE|nr:hypothetical protein [Ruegeria sp. HKCCD7255]